MKYDNLKEKEQLYEKLSSSLYDGSLNPGDKEYVKASREYKSLTPLIEKYREWVKVFSELSEAKSIVADKSMDAELKELAQMEIEEKSEILHVLEDELDFLLLPSDPDDDRNVIVEIRGGAGGEEAALFSSVLYRMYSMFASSHNMKIEVLNLNETELGGIKEISFLISGLNAYKRLKFESGVHRVQRVPETETQGRVHTSTATVAVLPEIDEVEVEINPADLEIDTFRASGAGGQHINKTESAIRITHKPSGLVVECQDERSQHKNRAKAMKVLASRLYEIEKKKQADSQASLRSSQVGTGDRSERIRTYNYPQGRITDHRIGFSVYKFDDFLNGALDEMIDALTKGVVVDENAED